MVSETDSKHKGQDMRAVAFITTLAQHHDAAELPEALLYEDPSGRVAAALAAENQGELGINRWGNGKIHQGAGKARLEYLVSQRYRWVWMERPELGLVLLNDLEHSADIFMGQELVRTWLGLIPADQSSVRVSIYRPAIVPEPSEAEQDAMLEGSQVCPFCGRPGAYQQYDVYGSEQCPDGYGETPHADCGGHDYLVCDRCADKHALEV